MSLTFVDVDFAVDLIDVVLVDVELVDIDFVDVDLKRAIDKKKSKLEIQTSV